MSRGAGKKTTDDFSTSLKRLEGMDTHLTPSELGKIEYLREWLTEKDFVNCLTVVSQLTPDELHALGEAVLIYSYDPIFMIPVTEKQKVYEGLCEKGLLHQIIPPERLRGHLSDVKRPPNAKYFIPADSAAPYVIFRFAKGAGFPFPTQVEVANKYWEEHYTKS